MERRTLHWKKALLWKEMYFRSFLLSLFSGHPYEPPASIKAVPPIHTRGYVDQRTHFRSNVEENPHLPERAAISAGLLSFLAKVVYAGDSEIATLIIVAGAIVSDLSEAKVGDRPEGNNQVNTWVQAG